MRSELRSNWINKRIPSVYLRIAAWVVLCFGTVITVSTVGIVQRFESDELKGRFEDKASHVAESIESIFSATDPVLLSLSSYFSVEDEVSQEVFSALALPSVKHYPYIQALEWVPLVTAAEKNRFETRVRQQNPEFKITERDSQGELIPAANDRPFYYPVSLVAPLDQNQPALGFDLASNPSRLETIKHAIERRELTLSPKVSLVQDTVKSSGLLLFYPVYQPATRGQHQNTHRGADKPVKGFVLAVFRLSVLLDEVAKTAMSSGLYFDINDQTSAGAPALLFSSRPAELRGQPEAAGHESLSLIRTIDVGGRRWDLQFSAIPGQFTQKFLSLSWIALLFGTLVTGVFSALLFRLGVLQKRYELNKTRLVEAFPHNACDMGTWEWHVKRDQLTLSEDAQQILNTPKALTDGNLRTYLKFVSADDRDRVEQQILNAVHNKSPFKIKHKASSDNSIDRYIECGGFVELDKNGDPLAVIGIVADVTAETLARNQIAENERLMSWVMSATGEGLWDWDLASGMVGHNQKWYEHLGYNSDEVSGDVDGFNQIIHPEDKATVFERVNVALGKRIDYQSEHRLVCKDGTVIWVMDRGRIVETDESGAPTRMVGAYVDITDQKNNEETISQLAFYDPLTGLANRRLLENEIRKTMAKHTRSGGLGVLIFIDLDDFKTLNDTQGHDVGDMLLQAFAELLKKLVRDSDTVARVGGDEFVVLIDDAGDNETDAADAGRRVASKILSVTRQTFDLKGFHYKTTASIGLTQFGMQGDTIVEAFKRADLAMYQAKQAGKNAYRFFDPETQQLLDREAATEADLLQALPNGEIVPMYQPIGDENGKLIGAETLCRWRHPTRGMVSPAEFIPCAEKSGLIVQIDELMLNYVCQQLAAWRNEAKRCHLIISVNVSARYFGFPDFIERLFAMCERHGTPMDKLKIELTESMLLKNIAEAARKVKDLSDHGVRFSLDDFGTGYSSLSYLQNLKINELKIDQSFVGRLPDDLSSSAICRSILALAKSLNLSVVAEGVETIEQRDYLRTYGCTFFQGYLIGRPCSPEELASS